MASFSNIVLTRANELLKGTEVFDEYGNSLGASKTAGIYGVAQSGLTRCVLVPCACLLLPPIMLHGLRSLSSASALFATTRRADFVQLSLIYMSLQAALPACLAIFPQVSLSH